MEIREEKKSPDSSHLSGDQGRYEPLLNPLEVDCEPQSFGNLWVGCVFINASQP